MSSTRRARASSARERETRASIIAAARRLARQYGPHKLAMEDIAAACGKTKSFLYYYYPSKRELLKAIVAAELGEMRQAVRDAVKTEQGAADKLKTFVRARLEVVIRQMSSVGVATVDRFLRGAHVGWGDFKDLLELRRAFDQEDAEIVTSLLQLGIAEGTFRPMTPALIKDLADFLMAALRGVELELALEADYSLHFGLRITEVVEVLMAGITRSSSCDGSFRVP